MAAGAIKTAPTGLDNALDQATVTMTCFTLPAIDQELVLEAALTPFAIHVVRQGGAVVLYRRV